MKLLRIWYDDAAESPREWDNLGTMVCWHRRYVLGDRHSYECPDDLWYALAEEIIGDTDKVERMTSDRRKQVAFKGAVILPLYLYDHGGITIRTTPFSCPWDSGQVGWIYVTHVRLRKEFNTQHVTKSLVHTAEEILRCEVEVYDTFLTNNVYGFTIYDITSDNITELDMCGGFYGDDPKCNGMLDYVPDGLRASLRDAGYIYDGLIITDTGQTIEAGTGIGQFLLEHGLLDASTMHTYDLLMDICVS